MTKNSIKVLAASEPIKSKGTCVRTLMVQNAVVKKTEGNDTLEYETVVLSLVKVDRTDPEDQGCDGIHMFLDDPKQVDRLIKKLKWIRKRTYGPKGPVSLPW